MASVFSAKFDIITNDIRENVSFYGIWFGHWRWPKSVEVETAVDLSRNSKTGSFAKLKKI